MEEEQVPITDTISNFNSFVTEFRFKAENLIKQVLLVSGSIQIITISAFLNGNPPKLSESVINLLKCGWLFLSASIILCLTVMLLQVIALAHVTNKKARKLKSNTPPAVEVMNTWPALRFLTWGAGLSAFFCCIFGVYTISKAAIFLIGSGYGV